MSPASLPTLRLAVSAVGGVDHPPCPAKEANGPRSNKTKGASG